MVLYYVICAKCHNTLPQGMRHCSLPVIDFSSREIDTQSREKIHEHENKSNHSLRYSSAFHRHERGTQNPGRSTPRAN